MKELIKITLNKKERVFLQNKFYLIVNGSVRVYDVFENGKFIPKETSFKKGEIIGNFFKCFPNENLPFSFPETRVQVVALENDTLIQEIQFELESIATNMELSKIIMHLIKENIFKIFYHLYDMKGYLLAILKFCADHSGKISKEQLRHENFLMSKSHFYKTYTELKEGKYIDESDKHIYLNLKKVEEYF